MLIFYHAHKHPIYPEYPILEGSKVIRKVRNVWKPWIEDSEDDIAKSFSVDRSETDDFYIYILYNNCSLCFSCISCQMNF